MIKESVKRLSIFQVFQVQRKPSFSLTLGGMEKVNLRINKPIRNYLPPILRYCWLINFQCNKISQKRNNLLDKKTTICSRDDNTGDEINVTAAGVVRDTSTQ